MVLKDLPVENRPREKLLLRGPHALADNELLAIVLRTGIPGKGVLQWANEVLKHFHGIGGLLHANAQALQQVKGLGPAKRAELLAVLELAKRCLQAHLQERPLLNSSQAMRDFLQLQLGAKPHEVFGVVYLDTQHKLIAFEALFRGSLNQTAVYPREVARLGLQYHASAVVLAHNHPSGNPDPSTADLELTKTLKDALALLDMHVLDHIIVTPGASVSLLERGLL